MNSLQRYVPALSRVLMAIVFLLNGLGIIIQAGAAKELLEHGAPASLVPLLMLSARPVEIVAGFSLALGVYPRLAAVAILAFLIPATLTAHAFWQVSGTAAFTPQLLNFFKNTAMMGGLLFIAATQTQPTLLPRTAWLDSREWMRNEDLSQCRPCVLNNDVVIGETIKHWRRYADSWRDIATPGLLSSNVDRRINMSRGGAGSKSRFSQAF